LPGFRIDGLWTPARIAGGDYFDALMLGEGIVAVCIADVSGKGMPAALMMSNLQAAVKSHASRDMRPRDLCSQLNRLMCHNTGTERFITFFYAVLDGQSKRLTFCNAGHNPPILVTNNSTHSLETGGGVLGVIEGWRYEEQEIQLRSSD